MFSSATQTFINLLETSDEQGESRSCASSSRRMGTEDPYAKAGLFAEDQKCEFKRRCAAIRFLPPVLIFALVSTTSSLPIGICVLVAFNTLIFSHLYAKSRLEAAQAQYVHSIEFYIPLVMERLVMAVQAGLDLHAAIRKLGELAEHDENADEIDPVTQILLVAYDLNEAGVPFEKALKQVSQKYDIPALRHAFLHLAHAYKEGGGVVGPLRELSDASQSQFQDKMEEFIAKLPVRATAPLACCFVGLILALVTIPLVSVLDFTVKSQIGG